MAVGFSPEEVQRAKNQLSSSIFMSLESRMVLYDDIGRQVLSYGHRKPAEEVCCLSLKVKVKLNSSNLCRYVSK